MPVFRLAKIPLYFLSCARAVPAEQLQSTAEDLGRAYHLILPWTASWPCSTSGSTAARVAHQYSFVAHETTCGLLAPRASVNAAGAGPAHPAQFADPDRDVRLISAPWWAVARSHQKPFLAITGVGLRRTAISHAGSAAAHRRDDVRALFIVLFNTIVDLAYAYLRSADPSGRGGTGMSEPLRSKN